MNDILLPPTKVYGIKVTRPGSGLFLYSSIVVGGGGVVLWQYNIGLKITYFIYVSVLNFFSCHF